MLGSPGARYVLREGSDFQCRACANAEATVIPLVKALAQANILRFVVYDLASQDNAIGAVVAATCIATIDSRQYWGYRPSFLVHETSG